MQDTEGKDARSIIMDFGGNIIDSITRVKEIKVAEFIEIPLTDICCFLLRISSISVLTGDLATTLSEIE